MPALAKLGPIGKLEPSTGGSPARDRRLAPPGHGAEFVRLGEREMRDAVRGVQVGDHVVDGPVLERRGTLPRVAVQDAYQFIEFGAFGA